MKDLSVLRAALSDYYMHKLAGSVEDLRVRVYERLDELDKNEPGQNAYKLKAAQYRTIAEEFVPHLFDHMPFYFETGAVASYGDGHYARGGRHANGWLLERNSHIIRERYPEEWKTFCHAQSDKLYLTCGPFFDTEHTPIPMTKIFTVGLSGIHAEAVDALSRCTTEEERDFVEASIAGLEALKLIADKFAAAAKKRLETETDPENISNFELIADTAARVPWNPPKTFYEGMVTLAFMRKAIGSLEGYGYNSVGRPDLLIGPLLESDLAAGVSRDEMYDLMCRFMLIWDCHVDHDKVMAGYADYEYENSITIGGIDADGNEVFNDVTRMFVESALELDLIYPKLMCRFGSGSSEEYLKLISKPLLKSKNIFLFENDDTMIPALVSAGYSLAQARNYVISGCWDTVIGDYNKPMCGEYTNLLRALEWTVHMPKEKLAENMLDFKPISGAKSFEEVYSIFLSNAEQIIKQKALLNSVGGKAWKDVSPLCLTSALMVNPLKNLKDISDGGTGYPREQMNFAGFPDVVDSLLSIKRLCFDKKICTLDELIDQCENDWEDEGLRHIAASSPAFGDGDDESNALAARLSSDLYRLTRGLPTLFGGEFAMGYYMYTEVIWWGKLIAATPNGRHAGYYISHGVTPTRLHEIKSVTDVLRSIKAMDLEKCAANSIANVMLPLAKIDEDRMVGFIRACAKTGIEAIQINCVSRDELLAAQKDPEHYKHIIVRVTGFSCQFVMLSKEWQEEVLSRNYYN